MEVAMESRPDELMRLLGEHVPITLLIDLLCPPMAREVFRAEGGQADWLSAPRAA
jgi:hypothetical protein